MVSSVLAPPNRIPEASILVPRPLFIEEHGLRLYLSHAGVGVELNYEQYETGDWAKKVAEAWYKGRKRKLERREGRHTEDRKTQCEEMASLGVDWVNRWYQQEG